MRDMDDNLSSQSKEKMMPNMEDKSRMRLEDLVVKDGCLMTPRGTVMARMCPETWDGELGRLAYENARYIAKACSSHEDLLEALKGVVKCFPPGKSMFPRIDNAGAHARAAIARAEEEAS